MPLARVLIAVWVVLKQAHVMLVAVLIFEMPEAQM